MILVGTMTPSAILIPQWPIQVLNLTSSWQIPSLLLCALICGPKSAVIAAIAYLTIGIFYLPVFHGGGSLGYLLTPDFGYLIGFLPGSWICGELARQKVMKGLIGQTIAAISGVLIVHATGILNLLIGTLVSRWAELFPVLLLKYSLIPGTSQLLLCPAIGLIAIAMKKFLLIK